MIYGYTDANGDAIEIFVEDGEVKSVHFNGVEFTLESDPMLWCLVFADVLSGEFVITRK